MLASFSFIINCGLIALIWWCAHKLTWDCTMIDETEPSSGEGLLDAAGLQAAKAAPATDGKVNKSWCGRLACLCSRDGRTTETRSRRPRPETRRPLE